MPLVKLHISLTYRKLLFLAIFFTVVSQVGYAQEEEVRDPITWKVSFEGNDMYSNMVLRQIVATQSPRLLQKFLRKHEEFILNERELRRDLIRVERYYQRRGYHQVEVDYEIKSRKKEWQKEIHFTVREGSPLQIQSTTVEIDTDTVADAEQEISESSSYRRAIENHEFREGRRYENIRTPDVEGQFTRLLENHGYPWADVSIDAAIDSISNEVDITINLNPGSKAFFNQPEIDGELSVPNNVVLRETGIREGDLYNRNQLQEAQRQLFNHHLFRFATVNIPDQPQDSTLDIQIRIREHPLRSVQTSIGFGREELLRGQVGWQHRNISRTGHRFGVRGRASFIDQRLTTDYLIPYVFNPKSSFLSSLFGQHRLEPAYELFQMGFNNSLIYQFERNATVSSSYEFTINEELSRTGDASLPDSVLNYNISALTFNGYYNQSVSREPEGWMIQPFVELSGLFGEASFSFQKLYLDVRRYTPLTNSLTLATRINSGAIFYTQPDSLPANIRFFSGGTNSVRGWSRQSLGPKRAAVEIEEIRDENDNLIDREVVLDEYVPIGGRAMFTFNIELRQKLTSLIPNFGVAAFLDGGQVWRALNRIDERPIQFGAGGGIRYQSPIGPLRVDVAYKINPSDTDLNIFDGVDYGSKWDRIGIHFSIGQAF